MKKVKIIHAETKDLSSIISDQRRYSALLGNGIRVSFSNRKDLTYCMAEINRHLNTVTFELNEIWIFFFAEYRRLWYYLPPHHYASDEQIIIENNAIIAKAFNMLTERSGWANGNTFSWKNLYAIIEALLVQVQIFIAVRKKKKQFLESRLLEMKMETLKRIRQNLQTLTVDARYGR